MNQLTHTETEHQTGMKEQIALKNETHDANKPETNIALESSRSSAMKREEVCCRQDLQRLRSLLALDRLLVERLLLLLQLGRLLGTLA